MDQSLKPSSRPRRGVLAVLGGGVVAALVGGALVVGGTTAAGASGLETFSSCEELRAWGEDASGGTAMRFEEIGAPIAADADGAGAAESSTAGSGDDSVASPTPTPGPVSTTAPSSTVAVEGTGSDPDGASAAEGAEPADDATNVIVEGIDEPDLVERLGGDRALVVGGQTLAVADLAAAGIVASTRVPWGAQITYDSNAGVAWSVGYGDRGETLVQRFVVGESELTADGSWSTTGQLVSARRQGGELLVVATDGFHSPVMFEEIAPDDAPAGDDTGNDTADDAGNDTGDDDGLPFGADPVPCDQVLHPTGPAEPTSTLLVVLPVSGPLEPIRSTQVVGAGANVHVTVDAAYLATPTWDDASGSQSVGLHRFDLASLDHTGSGAVEGSLLNDFSLSEHDGHLRVAVTVGGGFFGMPVPVDVGGGIGDGTVGDVGGPMTRPAFDPAAASTSSTEVPEPPTPDDASPDAGATGPETTTTTIAPAAGTADQAPANLRAPASGVEDAAVIGPEPTFIEPMPTMVGPGPEMPVINEIVVLDTDGDLDVVGRTPRFGHPGESLHGIRFEGTVAYAVTFLQTDPFYVIDLSDPTDPTILGEVELPGFSAYLHPISATEVVGFGPDESGRASAKLFDVSDRTAPRVVDSIVLGDESAVVWDHHAFTSLGENRFAVPATSWGSHIEPACDVCPGGDLGGFENSLVVLAVTDGRLVEEERIAIGTDDAVVRVIPASDGWGLLGSQSLTVLDAAGSVRATLPLA